MNTTLYRYHGIAYTYADLQAAYRRQQAETHKAINCGDYAAACDINNKDVREYLPQMTAPERSGTTRQQKSDKKTLTAPQKCGIIKAIRRHLRRWKRKQEEKTMNRNEIEQLAAEIRNSDTWIPELLEQLCECAGMLDEWNAADGETFETVVYNAAKKLGVEI